MKNNTARKQKEKSLEQLPRRQGRKELARHLQGRKTTPQGAMRAKCYECMGFYIDGAGDCGIQDCPIHPWMPYRQIETPTDEV